MMRTKALVERGLRPPLPGPTTCVEEQAQSYPQDQHAAHLRKLGLGPLPTRHTKCPSGLQRGSTHPTWKMQVKITLSTFQTSYRRRTALRLAGAESPREPGVSIHSETHSSNDILGR
ncbi:UNVERIFIED_CONTAM: hypothetical protein Slati_1441500 [Sesamum latifolium]|uniref:Uncharacterized protein n=1 Tax=Sesamum latifolium TaxID=2727402 RepID=A0AAW2X5I3_9LAMI